MKPTVSIRDALTDPALLGNVLAGPSWKAWRTLLIAAMGEPLDDDERALFKELTGREQEPLQRVEELCCVIGRRGGKSRAMATLACYIGALCKHEQLVRGERGVCLCVAPDMKQAGIILEYATAAFEASPILRQLIASRTADALELTNGTSIEVRAASFRRLRGPTYIAVIADESAFWLGVENSANPDAEIINAVRPGLATTNGMLIIASSPYARRGVLWDTHRRNFGAAGDPLVLVAQGSSRTLNETLPQSVVDRALERDRASAEAEFMAVFRTDIESFVSLEAVEACVATGVLERGPLLEHCYVAFCDPSGGSADSMTLCIGHIEFAKETVIVDAVREARPPFSPEAVVGEFCALLKMYRVSVVCGDRYAGEWPREQFSKFGVIYQPAAKPKSELYGDLLPLLNSRRIDLLDHSRLINQLYSLERRTARGGKDSIDHPPGAHDDIANAIAGVAQLAVVQGVYDVGAIGRGLWGLTPEDPIGADGWRRARLAAFLYSGGQIR